MQGGDPLADARRSLVKLQWHVALLRRRVKGVALVVEFIDLVLRDLVDADVRVQVRLDVLCVCVPTHDLMR